MPILVLSMFFAPFLLPLYDQHRMKAINDPSSFFLLEKLFSFPIQNEYVFSSFDASLSSVYIASFSVRCLFPIYFGKYPPPGLADSFIRQ